jgi:hypothetical protein
MRMSCPGRPNGKKVRGWASTESGVLWGNGKLWNIRGVMGFISSKQSYSVIAVKWMQRSVNL